MAKLFRNGIMISCATDLCQRKARFVNPTKTTTNTIPAWLCDLCVSGKGPFIAKPKAKR